MFFTFYLQTKAIPPLNYISRKNPESVLLVFHNVHTL